ncbi:pre-rRNA-processing protein ESF1 [Vitis riparia]|nr:pre-rRNA-processing protein ESF1 [Vitis riparia]
MGSKKSNDRKKMEKEEEKVKKESDSAGGAEDRRSKNGGKIVTDARFSSLHSDPRFQKVPKHKSKVEIDSRFNRMFHDKSFTASSAPLDKRGKPKKDRSGNTLSHYYRLEEQEEEEKKKEISSEEDEDENEIRKLSASESDGDSELSGAEYESESDASSTGSDTDEEDDGVYSEEESPAQEENIPVIEQETHRLAVVNMEWRQVKAVDLFMVLSSFLPKDGHILSVAIYPSEFGLKRMEEEAVHGPIGLFDDEKEQSDDDGDNEIDDEKLRAYEKSRLSYYYAVVDCDSSATADYLYKACDGIEFERSSNVLDLRFIPDSMEFKHPPHDIATEAPAKYEGLDFHTRALQHSKIHISWDEDEPQRAKTLKRKYNDDEQAELAMKEFLASDTDESETDDNENDDQSDKEHKRQNKYLALLESGDGSDRDDEEDGQDMEVTFNTGLEDISKRILEKREKKSETVWEAYLKKRSEKRKARKNRSKYSSEDESDDTDQELMEQPDDFFVEEHSAKGTKEVTQGKNDKKKKKLQQETGKEAEVSRAELELLLADEEGADTSVKGYNLKRKKSKGRKGQEAPDEDKIPAVDYDDPRFSSIFTSPLFALDPTDPQFKRSATYARQLAQKQQQKSDGDALRGKEAMKLQKQTRPSSDGPEANKDQPLMSDVLSSKREKHELSSLVRSIKTKSKQVKLPSNGKKPRKSENMLFNKKEEKGQDHELSSLVQSVKKKARVLQK